MTLTTLHNRLAYVGNGVVTVYPYTFLILDDMDLLVYHDDVLQSSGYTISGVGTGSGGNVTYTTAPAAGVEILFLRATDLTQQVNLVEGDRLPAESVEAMFDKAYAAIQDLAGALDRTIQLESTSALSEVTLPDPGAGQFIRWNAAGTALEVATILSTDVVSPIVAKGDLIQGGVAAIPERLAIGTTGQLLTVVDGKAAWGSSGAQTLIDDKGDLLVGTAADTLARKAVGADGRVLTADATQPDGLRWATPGGSDIPLRIEAATLPDGTGSTNAPPEIVREVSAAQTANTPKRTRTYAKFDAAADENLCWGFLMPANYGSGGTIRLKWKAASGTSGNVIWKAGIGATIDGSTADGTVVYNAEDLATASAAPGTAGQVVEVTIALTVTNVAASRDTSVFIGRKGSSGSDTMTGDAILMSARLEYTPA